MKNDRVYLLHIRESIELIMEFTADGRESFFSDKKTQAAVIRHLEVIGEAVKNVSEATKAALPGIPWKQLAGMRDKLIHHYFGVDLRLVWDVAIKVLPGILENINSISAEDENRK